MTHPAPQPSRDARNRRPKGQTILHLEALEDRTLLSATPIPIPLPAAPYDPTHILVQFRTTTPPAINAPGAVLGQSLDLVSGLYEVNLTGLSVAQAVTEFQANPNVISAEPDYLVAAAGVPNDPIFGSQYALQNTGQSGGTPGVDIRAVQAWDVTSSASKVIVSLIDTGIDYNHPDLYQNIWINQAEIPDRWYTKSSDGTFDKIVNKSQITTATAGVITFADLNNSANKGLVWDANGDGRIDAGDLLRPLTQGGWNNNGQDTKDGDTAHPDDFFGWNFVANNNNPYDDNGHGTNVAGILGATGNNAVGVAGVDWAVQMQAIKAFDNQGFSTIGNVLSAIGYSIKHGAKISNNSWAYRAPSTALFNAMSSAQAAGQIFVAAAGNFSNPQPDYPANYSTQLNNIVAVTDVDRSGKLAPDANYGATSVALGAPGVNVVSTAPGGGYSVYSGTSQAAPFVAGVLALVWQQHPTWTYQQVIQQVLSTTTPLASLKGKTITGGIVNAAAAVGAGGHVAGPTPHALTAVFRGPDAYSLNQILLTFDQPIDRQTITESNFSLVGPSGQSVFVSFTPSTDGLRLELDFFLQTAPGNYTLSIKSGVHDQNGDALAPFSATYVVAAPPSNTFTSTGPTAIPNGGTFVSTITVNRDLPIASVNVVLNINYPVDSDLLLHLQAPDGTDILLVNQRGGAGANFQNTVLSDQGHTSIRFAPAPFAGTFQPETPLSTFAGKNARGVWKLTVVDLATGRAGILTNWSLVFTPRAAAPAVAGVNGENSAPAPVGGDVTLAGEPDGASIYSDADQAAVDAVFLSDKAINDWRKALLPSPPPLLVEHAAYYGA